MTQAIRASDTPFAVNVEAGKDYFWCSCGGSKNQPFYNDAESVVGFVDGHAGFIKIYYDGINAAYTRDPITGYDYKYSGE